MHTLDSLTAPQRFCLPQGYQQRLQPDYFNDDADDGITWQPDVYPHTADTARRLGSRSGSPAAPQGGGPPRGRC